MIVPGRREKEATAELLDLAAGVRDSEVLDGSPFPTQNVHVYGGTGGDAPSGLTAVVLEGNVPGMWITKATLHETDLAAGGLIVLTPGKYCQVKVTALSSGKVGATWHGFGYQS